MMRCPHGSTCGGKCVDCGLLVLRIVVAIIFVYHGYGKLFGGTPGMEGFTGFLGSLGVPAAGAFAWVIALLEFFGGIALLLGVLIPYVAGLLAVEMLVAFLLASKGALPKGDLELALFGITLALALGGSGAYALMRGKAKDAAPPAA